MILGKKIGDWLLALLYMSLPVIATLIIVHAIYMVFGRLYNEKETILFYFADQISVLMTMFAFHRIQGFGFMKFPKMQMRPTILSIMLGLTVWIFGTILYSITYPGSHPCIKNSYALCLSILTFIMSPIVEEMFFRGWVLSYMESRSLSKINIILTISVMFFLYHWVPVIPIYSRLDTFVFSIIACCLYFKTRDLRYCMLMHFTMNFVNSVVKIVPYLLG